MSSVVRITISLHHCIGASLHPGDERPAPHSRHGRGGSAAPVGFGQLLGGGGLLAMFMAGGLLSNGRDRIGRFEQQALGRVLPPLNTATDITVLLLLGLLVKPAALLTVLPLGLALANVVPLALAEPLGAQLLALIVVVVLPLKPEASPP